MKDVFPHSFHILALLKCFSLIPFLPSLLAFSISSLYNLRDVATLYLVNLIWAYTFHEYIKFQTMAVVDRGFVHFNLMEVFKRN